MIWVLYAYLLVGGMIAAISVSQLHKQGKADGAVVASLVIGIFIWPVAMVYTFVKEMVK